jgi:hypothetical protein
MRTHVVQAVYGVNIEGSGLPELYEARRRILSRIHP